ncbi:MAG: response regulator transcription factor [Candidatus Tectomicrobia bacterium]|nr:response regulator transcription factor [Candidatus Tectomicrobia bacterium]HEX2279278.1 response regulator transcription factor [Candidatus Tectomicrobia bacterium]
MKILIAEDDMVSRVLLEATLIKWGYEVTVACDGVAAWELLQSDDPPSLAILDWMMPGLDGLQICRKIRDIPTTTPPYLILLTAKGRREDIVTGLQAGADDYVTKPFDREELHARVQVGMRIIELQHSLADRVKALEEALARVKQLQGLLPICSYCKKIRDDQNYWQQVENYISKHSEAQFSHSICPDCYESLVRPELDQLRRTQDQAS